jgi:hypothetical protein
MAIAATKDAAAMLHLAMHMLATDAQISAPYSTRRLCLRGFAPQKISLRTR